MMRSFRHRAQGVSILFFLLLTGSAASQAPAPRLRGPIAGGERTALAHTRSPQALPAEDEGSVAANTTIPGMTLVFKRSPEQQAALEQLLADQQNPASPRYQQWLTPDTFAARFGMADADLAAAQSWLQSQGFHIDSVPHSRDRITFTGTALQVQAAFGTELHHFRTERELHFAPASDLSLPTALAGVTAAVLHLSDFRPRPSVKPLVSPQPDFTSGSTQTHYLTPGDLLTMYDLVQPSNTGPVGPTQQLAVVGQSSVDTSIGPVANFFYQVLHSGNISKVLVPNSGVEATSPGDLAESELDVEYASTFPRISNVLFVYVGANRNYNVFDALAYAITENAAPVISISYGTCESLLSATFIAQSNALFAQAAAQGQTLVAASGDSGSTGCAPYSNSQGVSSTQQQDLAVSFPADSPYVTAVGGTQMAAGTFTAGNTQYWLSSAYDLSVSLRSYVPETTWNEGSVNLGIMAGGGGISKLYPRPSWQTGVPGLPAGNYRLVPDVALLASTSSPGYAFCTGDESFLGAGGQTASCNVGLSDGKGRYTVGGGTSFAAPVFAAFVATLNDAKHTTGLGNINPVLYALASNPSTYASAFHDITSGTNACVAGAYNCTAAGRSGFAAGVGYDLATGLGSVDVLKLIAAWPSTVPPTLAPTATAIEPYALSALPGNKLSFQVHVGPTTYTPQDSSSPTGTLAISLDGLVLDPAVPFSSKAGYAALASYSFLTPPIVGSHIVTAVYSGDSTHAKSKISASLTVGTTVASGSFSLTAAGLTVSASSTGDTQIVLTPAGGYNGRVLWSLTAATSTPSTSQQTICYSVAPISTPNSTSTKLTMGVGSTCSAAPTGNVQEQLPFHVLPAVQAAGLPKPRRDNGSMVAYSAALLCGFLLPFRGRFRPTLLPLVAVVLVPFVALTGCGGKAATPAAATTTTTTATPSIYTITLTGTDSVNTSIRAATTFTLTVK